MHKFHHASRCTSFCACEEASSITLCIGFDWRVVVLGFGGYFDLASLGLLDFQICFFVVFFCFLFWLSIWVHGGLFGSLIWIVGFFLSGWWQYFEWLVVFWWLASLPYMEFWVMGDGDLCNCACIWRVENYAKFSLLPWNKHWKMISIVFSSWQPNMV